jgi:hypothetical protein
MKFALSELIESAYYGGRMQPVVVYGAFGSGKSSYSIQVMKEFYEDKGWREYMVFTPAEIVELVGRLIKDDRRIPVMTIDDAGVALYRMDFYQAGVINAMKWIQVARPYVGSIIFTVPSREMLVKQVFSLEGLLVGKPIRISGEAKTKRRITLYRNSIAPYGKRYINPIAEDDFNVMLPNDDFEYYTHIRKGYVKETQKRMAEGEVLGAV